MFNFILVRSRILGINNTTVKIYLIWISCACVHLVFSGTSSLVHVCARFSRVHIFLALSYVKNCLLVLCVTDKALCIGSQSAPP